MVACVANRVFEVSLQLASFVLSVRLVSDRGENRWRLGPLVPELVLWVRPLSERSLARTPGRSERDPIATQSGRENHATPSRRPNEGHQGSTDNLPLIARVLSECAPALAPFSWHLRQQRQCRQLFVCRCMQHAAATASDWFVPGQVTTIGPPWPDTAVGRAWHRLL